jgi:hypothetical protein
MNEQEKIDAEKARKSFHDFFESSNKLHKLCWEQHEATEKAIDRLFALVLLLSLPNAIRVAYYLFCYYYR